MSSICICNSFGCGKRGGVKQTPVTLARHVKLDVERSIEAIPIFEPINEWDVDVDPDLYKSHWSAKARFNNRLSLLEYCFDAARIFVSQPNASKESVSNHLYTNKYNLAETLNNDLPETFDQMVNILTPFLMPQIVYHVCKNDCIIYRKEYETATRCPVCEEDRYKSDGRTGRRYFTYFPLTPRIRRWIITKNTCDLLLRHLHIQRDPFVQRDIQDSAAWKEWFKR